MAAEGEVTTDVKAHVKSYSGFVRMMKWGTIVSLVVAAFVVLLIAS
ncbi:MAG TPA: aa3-type cytochrome c oxidase subunit IV [Allosphingosinicella sp.]|nr:aa3-type cytochrome c oxidase subunit IV [Allosphingosinicella sp.]